jgi:hypothetical protein
MSDEKKSGDEKSFVMKDGGDKKKSSSPMPELTFSTFVFSLNSSALVHLGVIKAPSGEQNLRDLSLAKQTIDILGILKEKTKGNLSSDEENLLKNILHDLRLMYVREKG